MLEGSQEPPANGQEPVASGSKRASKGDVSQKAKRVRVSRACDQCRAGREKCDGAQPICQTCEAQGRSCTYNEQPKKRGIQPNYIRTLELTLAWIFENFPESANKISTLLPDSHDRAHQMIAWKDAVPAEALHTSWRHSLVCRQIDQLLSGAEIELPPETAAQSHEIDQNAGAASYQSPPPSVPSDTGAIQRDTIESITANMLSPLHEATVTKSDLLRLPPNSWALLEHYFAFTHTWLPMVERHDVLKLMYSYPQGGLRKQDAAGAGHAELWSIMALALLQTGAEDFVVCRDIAKSLIPSEHGFQLGHIKALLILGLIEIMQRAWLPAWLVIGSAIRLLSHFNLGKGTSTTLFEGRTKHTLLAAFVLERAIASQTGAITHIRPADIQHVGFLIEDGLEEWSPWSDPTAGANSNVAKSPARSMSTFNELVRIALQFPRDHTMSSPGAVEVSSMMEALTRLLANASDSTQRQHPSQVLADRKVPAAVHTSPIHARNNSSHMDFTTPFVDNTHYPFMSIPNETTESLASSTPANQMQQIAGPSNWANAAIVGTEDNHDTALATDDAGTSNVAPDVFEELAMLDRTDFSLNPSFMQNLGFGPDLDLAEFFGADYQPSNPLLTYMQPATYAGSTQDFDTSGNDAG